MLNTSCSGDPTERVRELRQTDAKLAKLAAQLRDLPSMSYRFTANEETLKATDARVETSISNISQRLAQMSQYMGAIDTKLAVLTQRLESADGRRAGLREGRPPD